MIGFLGALLTIVLALGVTAGALAGLHDRSVLVSPPEATVEDFVRKLTTERYVRAHADLNDDVAKQVSPDSLRSLLHALERRVGKIVNVRGERLSMTDTSARAAAVVEIDRRRQVVIEFALRWSSGEWAVAGLGGLEREARALLAR